MPCQGKLKGGKKIFHSLLFHVHGTRKWRYVEAHLWSKVDKSSVNLDSWFRWKWEGDAIETINAVYFYSRRMLAHRLYLQFIWIPGFQSSPSTLHLLFFYCQLLLIPKYPFYLKYSAALKSNSQKQVWLFGCVYIFKSSHCFWVETDLYVSKECSDLNKGQQFCLGLRWQKIWKIVSS